jgi:hypothetical protein
MDRVEGKTNRDLIDAEAELFLLALSADALALESFPAEAVAALHITIEEVSDLIHENERERMGSLEKASSRRPILRRSSSSRPDT